MPDLYKSLGVERSASGSDIKKAFRTLTQKYHPDKNPGDTAAEDKFKEVSQAYEVLGDEDKRKLYDEFGDASLTQGFDPERARAYSQARRGGGPGGPGGFHYDFGNLGNARATSFDDLLQNLFGGGRVDMGGGYNRPRSRRGNDIQGEIHISLRDALAGTTVPLRIDASDGSARTLDVKVPMGMKDAGKLRLRGQGGQGEPRGDIMLTVRVDPDPVLQRDGDHLQMELEITALAAYRGDKVDVSTPWGEVTVKLPPGSDSGRTLRLRGKGVHYRNKDPGDLLVTLEVKMPPPGDEELLRVLERLQGTPQEAETA